MMSKAGRLALAIVAGSSALTFAAIAGFSGPDDNGAVKKSDRLRMEFTVACGSDVVSDAGGGCGTLASHSAWTKPGEAFATTAHQDGANTTILVKRRIEQ